MGAWYFLLVDYSLISPLALCISSFFSVFSKAYLQPEPSAKLTFAFYSIFIRHCFEEFCSVMLSAALLSKSCLFSHVVQLNNFVYTVSFSVSFLGSFQKLKY